MVINATTKTESGMPIISVWLSKLQENAKSEDDLLLGVVKSTSEKIQEFQDKAIEEAKNSDEEAEDDETSAVVTDEIQEPSEITSADLQSPIDIKL